jgi:hypothetical protein
MKALRLAMSVVCVVLLTACTYDSIRMHERQNCGAMVQSESTRCYARTQDTKAEYDTKRSKLKQSTNASPDKPTDPRYEQWIP